MRMALTGACILLSSLVAPAASADAIEPWEGGCPPGLTLTHGDHVEECSPIPCTSDHDCGSGAACHSIAECWAQRPDYGGRVRIDPPRMVDQVIGLCAADGSCAEGTCATRSQCEPTRDTDAWDRTARRWNQVPYHAPLVSCATTHARGSISACVLVALAFFVRRSAK